MHSSVTLIRVDYQYRECVFPKIHNAVHAGSPVSYGIGLFLQVIGKLRPLTEQVRENSSTNIYVDRVGGI